MKIMSVWVFLILFFSFFNHPLTNDNVINSSDADAVEKYAIIIGISDYEGDENDLNCPAESAIALYNELLSKDDWVEDNIYLLINESAKRNNIIDALNWLQTNSNKNDIVLFFFAGHGSTKPDENGDEAFDHAIISQDLEYMIDDWLNQELSKINYKGMYIIIDSCFSGGFNELGGVTGDNIETYEDAAEYINGVFDKCKDFQNQFTDTLSNTENRVIFTSSLPYAMGIEIDTPIHGWIDVSSGLPKAIKEGKTSAEDISQYVKTWWLTIPSVLNYIVLMILFHLIPSFNVIEYMIYCISGGLLTPLPIPLIVDTYPGKLNVIGEQSFDFSKIQSSEIIENINTFRYRYRNEI